MSTDEKYVFFWSGPFSQWQRSSFELDGVQFNTAEQSMMFLKARLFGDEDIAQKILKTPDARKQKSLGRKVSYFNEGIWVENREDIVLRSNREKFGQNKGLRRILFHTGNRLLVEASPLDLVWGIGLDEKLARKTPEDEWPGLNLLGKILTQVREELRDKYPDEVANTADDENEG